MYQLIDCIYWDKNGTALAEYALLVGLIAVVCIGAVTNFGIEVRAVLIATIAPLAAI